MGNIGRERKEIRRDGGLNKFEGKMNKKETKRDIKVEKKKKKKGMKS
jgi:hypothetical protein